ncbi:MAG: hypothetical protein FJ255_11175 [Phycisphaerae bacterium]|nr:hypothetical protein [Phycisphaerae bacterium]
MKTTGQGCPPRRRRTTHQLVRSFRSIDAKVFQAGPPSTAFSFPNVGLHGPGGRAWPNGPIATSPWDWLTLNDPVQESSWIVVAGTWAGLMANVTEMKVTMAASSTAQEITGVDAIRLDIPAPGSVAFRLALAASASRRRGRCRA